MQRALTLRIAALAFAVTLTGCESQQLLPNMPASISRSTSEFDNSTQVVMVPGWVYNRSELLSGASFKLGLLWRSTMKPGEVLIVAEYADGIEALGAGTSLHFNIDGEFVDVATIDATTDFDVERTRSPYVTQTTTRSSKRYLGSIDLVRRLVNARDVKVRLDLSRQFVEGVFSYDQPGAARPGFRKFLAELPPQQ